MQKSTKDLQVKIIRDSILWSYLPTPVKHTLSTYKEMREDARIGSLFEDRRNATQNLPVSLTTPEKQEIADYCNRYLTEANLRKWSFVLLDGSLTYGFQPAEIIWRQDADGYFYISGLDAHNIAQYRYDGDGNMFYGSHPCAEPYKWICHQIDGDSYNSPYGRPYLNRVYWPWKFKKLGWEFWLNATEKFSVPSLIALFEQSDHGKAQQTAIELSHLIEGINSGSGGALANIKDIKQISMTGNVADFDTLINACDLQIAYGMTGQALATNISNTGTQALGTVQERTKAAAYENDARALAYTMQKIIKMAIEANFGKDAEYPVFSYDTQDKATFSEVMQALGQGVPVSKKALYSRYGLPKPEDEEDALTIEQPNPMMGSAFNFSDDENKKKLQPIVIKY